MSWFDTAGLASFAKSALKEAQKQIDKALDIQEDELLAQQGLVQGGSKKSTSSSSSASKTEPSTPSYGGQPPTSSIPTSASNVWGSFTGSFFDADQATATSTVTTPPSSSLPAPPVDCSSDSVDLVTSPTSLSSGNNSPLQSTSTVLNSASIEVLGAVAEPRSENSSFMVVASSASSTPASEFSDAGDPIIEVEDVDEATTKPIPIEVKDDEDEDADEEDEDEEEEEENTVSESLAVTVMEPRGIVAKEIVTIPPSSRQNLHLTLSTNLTTEMDNSSSSEKTVTNQVLTAPASPTLIKSSSNNNNNAVLSLESYEMQTEFSDSTHSFEEVAREDSSSGQGLPCATNTSSGDELETATSSDIEIISNPNGCDGSSSTHSRLSPLKDNMGITAGFNKGHRGHSRELSAASSQGSDELLSETDRLHKRIIELSEQLEKREYKLMELVTLNNELNARNEELIQGGNAPVTAINQLSLLSSATAINNNNSGQCVDTVTAEFTHRLSALEKKFQHAIRERDQLREQLKLVNSRIPQDVHEAAVQEKDFLINELKQEGEKLSKQVLQHSTIIKKLRVKEKETDETIKRQSNELRDSTDEVERLKKSLTAKEDVERSQIEAVNQLTSIKIVLDAEKNDLRSKLEDLQQKFDAVQVSFSATKAELIDAKRKTKDLQSKSANLESKCADQRDERVKGDRLEKEVQELREKLRQLDLATQAREQTLRKENGDLMRRVEESEMRNEELNQQVASATVPILKQMQGLQATLNSRSENWERQERDLVEALTRAEDKLKVLVDIEKRSSVVEGSLRADVQRLEQKIAGLMLRVEQEAANGQQKAIEMQLRVADGERDGLRMREEVEREWKEKLKDVEMRLSEKVKDVEELEREVERMRVIRSKGAIETSTCQRDRFERDEFGGEAELECHHHLNHGGPSGGVGDGRRGSTPVLSREHSLDGSLTSNQWPLDDLDTMSNHGRPSLGSFYGGGGGGYGAGGGLSNFGGLIGGHTSTLENLQSNLKQREGEVYNLNWEMNRLQTQRNTLANEISEMTGQMEELSSKCAQHEAMLEQYKELQRKYDAMLQLYGEKVEEAEELRLDLQEAREAYKTQINELSFKLEQSPTTAGLEG